MSLWTKVPVELALDLRVRALSLAARGLVLELALRHGAVALCPGAEEAATLLGDAEGCPALRELLATGVARVDGAWLRLTVEWPHEGPVLSPAPVASHEVLAAAANVALSPETIRTSESYFNHRKRRWKDVPAGVTWAEWCASAEGRAWLAGEGVEGRRTACRRNGLERRNGATPSVAPSVATASQQRGTTPSPTPPPSENKEESEISDAQGGSVATKRGNGATPSVATGASQQVDRRPLVQEADVEALASVKGIRLEVRCAAPAKTRLVALLNEMEVTPEVLRVMGDLCCEPLKVWPWATATFQGRGKATVAWLLGAGRAENGAEAPRLHTLVARAHERVDAAKAPASAHAPTPTPLRPAPTAPRQLVTPEQMAAMNPFKGQRAAGG